MKIRIKFRKNGLMRFVGHLDLLRYFQRALRRAGIDMAYSGGFSPHPIISFASPLGLGLTSDGEYLDIEVNSTLSSCESIEAINREMADGIEIVGYVRLGDGVRKAMAAVTAADYIVYFRHSEDFSQDEIREGIRSYYTGRGSIPVSKKTKKGERVVDLNPLLYLFDPYCDDDVDPCRITEKTPAAGSGYILSDIGIRKGFFLRLSSGSAENIRPELVLEDFYSFLGKTYDPSNLQIHRLDLYESVKNGSVPSAGADVKLQAAQGEEGFTLVPLLNAGEEILCREES